MLIDVLLSSARRFIVRAMAGDDEPTFAVAPPQQGQFRDPWEEQNSISTASVVGQSDDYLAGLERRLAALKNTKTKNKQKTREQTRGKSANIAEGHVDLTPTDADDCLVVIRVGAPSDCDSLALPLPPAASRKAPPPAPTATSSQSDSDSDSEQEEDNKQQYTQYSDSDTHANRDPFGISSCFGIFSRSSAWPLMGLWRWLT